MMHKKIWLVFCALLATSVSGMDVQKNVQKCTAPAEFFDAARFGQINKLIKLLPQASKKDITDALYLSCGAGYFGIVEILWTKFKRENASQQKEQAVLDHALYSSCRYGFNPHLVAHLIKLGADVHNKRSQPLEMAVEQAVKGFYFEKHLEIIRVLLVYGADPKEYLDDGWAYFDPKGLKKRVVRTIKNHQEYSKKPSLKNMCLTYVLKNRDLFAVDALEKLPKEAILYS